MKLKHLAISISEKNKTSYEIERLGVSIFHFTNGLHIHHTV
jgi:hypothetical protein